MISYTARPELRISKLFYIMTQILETKFYRVPLKNKICILWPTLPAASSIFLQIQLFPFSFLLNEDYKWAYLFFFPNTESCIFIQDLVTTFKRLAQDPPVVVTHSFAIPFCIARCRILPENYLHNWLEIRSITVKLQTMNVYVESDEKWLACWETVQQYICYR